MSKLPAPPSFKSTIIQINPSKSDDSSSPRNRGSAEANPKKRQSNAVSFINSSSNSNSITTKKQKLKSSEKSTEEIERKKRENKAAHSIIEKKRRIKLNREFEALKIIVPACRNSIINSSSNNTGHANATGSAPPSNSNKDNINDGMYKLTILQASVDYINYLHEIIRIMHIKEKKLNAQLGQSYLDNDDSNVAFARLDLKLEKYRDLDIDFKYIEIMKIFKYMNTYSRMINKNNDNTNINKKRNSSYDAKLNYFANPDSINLYNDSDFDSFLLTKGIKQADIDTFHLFFDIVDVSGEPEINNDNLNSNNSEIKFKSSIFSLLDKSKASTDSNQANQQSIMRMVQDSQQPHTQLQRPRNDNNVAYHISNNNHGKFSSSASSVSSFTGYNGPTANTPATSLANQPYNISSFNTSPAINWKKFSPNISPATKYLDTTLMMKSGNNTTTHLSNEFQLPQPSIDVPANKAEMQQSFSGSNDFLYKSVHNGSSNGLTISPSGNGIRNNNIGSFQISGSPNIFSSVGNGNGNNGIKINTTLNNNRSSNNSEFFTLSPITFSSIIKSPKLDGLIGSNSLASVSEKHMGDSKIASEALMQIRKRSNSGSITGSITGLTNMNHDTATKQTNDNINKGNLSVIDDNGKRCDSKIDTILN